MLEQWCLNQLSPLIFLLLMVVMGSQWKIISDKEICSNINMRWKHTGDAL